MIPLYLPESVYLFTNEQPERIRQINTQNRQELRRVRHKYKNEGKTYANICGPALTSPLKDKTVELKGISHIMMPELIETTSATGVIKTEVRGMHWDPGRKLENAGLYKLENIRELPDGCYMADMWYQGVVKRDNTFFNSNWDLETLIQKTKDASHADLLAHFKWDKTFVSAGELPNELSIVFKLSKKGRIPTWYPQ